MRVYASVCLLLISATCCVAGEKTTSSDSGVTPTPSPQQTTIGVLGFVDKGPSVQLAILRKALAEGLSCEFAQFEGLQVVERNRIEDFLRETHLGETALIDPQTAQRAGQTLAAQFLLTGSFQATGKTITVEASLFRTGDANPMGKWQESFEMEQLFDFQSRLTKQVLALLKMADAKRRMPPPQSDKLPTVAVLAMENLGPSAHLDSMREGFADLIQVNLSTVPKVRVVDRSQIRQVLKEHTWTLAELSDSQVRLKIGRILGAECLIYGSFVELGERLRLDLRLADTKTTTIVRAETACGATKDFASLLETLSLRLAGDLAAPTPANSLDQMKAAAPTRNIEAALHLAAGDRFFRDGRYADAATSYERTLLVEPKNVQAGVRRAHAYSELKDFAHVIEASEQVLATGEFAAGAARDEPPNEWRGQFLSQLDYAYSATGNWEGAARVNRQIIAMFPDSMLANIARRDLADALLMLGRTDEAVRLLEEAVSAGRLKEDKHAYNIALQVLYKCYNDKLNPRSGQWHATANLTPSELEALSRKSNRRAMEILDLAFQEAKSHNNVWRWWGCIALDRLPRLENDAAREKLLYRILDDFSWVPDMPARTYSHLAEVHAKQGKWKEAIADYRWLLENEYHKGYVSFPPLADFEICGDIESDDVLIRRILSRQGVANATAQLQGSAAAIAEHEGILRDFGVLHPAAKSAIAAISEAKRPLPPAAESAALVWGGGSEAFEVWRKILRSHGYATVHDVVTPRLSAAVLSRYSLMVLVRTGNIPYLPGDVLAIRNFVATGGSLLVVVSPGWEPAQPSLHNPILSVFDIQAEQEMILRAECSQLAANPITHDIQRVMAKNAVELKAPPEAAVVRTGEKTMLAAIPYRQGRVAVGAFGQWFYPNVGFNLGRAWQLPWHETSRVPLANSPLEVGDAVELPLLEHVIDWLGEPLKSDASLRAKRRAFASAQQTAIQYQYGCASPEEFASAMKRLIDAMEPGMWKEEALWAAGEASVTPVWKLDWIPDCQMPGSRDSQHSLPVPDVGYFKRLAADYPNSPLQPFAQWRVADCLRWSAMPKDPKSNRFGLHPHGEAIPWLQQLKAPEGSTLWAWRELRLGLAYYHEWDLQHALAHFVAVAERMPNGPEKTIAVCNAAFVDNQLGKDEESSRYWKIAKTLPPITWSNDRESAAWTPMAFLRCYLCKSDTATIARAAERRAKDLRSP